MSYFSLQSEVLCCLAKAFRALALNEILILQGSEKFNGLREQLPDVTAAATAAASAQAASASGYYHMKSGGTFLSSFQPLSGPANNTATEKAGQELPTSCSKTQLLKE